MSPVEVKSLDPLIVSTCLSALSIIEIVPLGARVLNPKSTPTLPLNTPVPPPRLDAVLVSPPPPRLTKYPVVVASTKLPVMPFVIKSPVDPVT